MSISVPRTSSCLLPWLDFGFPLFSTSRSSDLNRPICRLSDVPQFINFLEHFWGEKNIVVLLAFCLDSFFKDFPIESQVVRKWQHMHVSHQSCAQSVAMIPQHLFFIYFGSAEKAFWTMEKKYFRKTNKENHLLPFSLCGFLEWPEILGKFYFDLFQGMFRENYLVSPNYFLLRAQQKPYAPLTTFCCFTLNIWGNFDKFCLMKTEHVWDQLWHFSLIQVLC